MSKIQINPNRLYPVLEPVESQICQYGYHASSTQDATSMDHKTPEEKTVSLIDGKQNYKRKNPQMATRSKSCSSSRLWIFFTVFFFITTVLAVGAFIWRYTIYEENQREEEKNNTLTAYDRYSGFFRSRYEQYRFEQQFFSMEKKEQKNVTKIGLSNQTCFVRCTNNFPNQGEPTARSGSGSGGGISSTTQTPNFTLPFQPAKQGVTLSNTHYHGCCISNTYFISPPVLPGIDDQPLTLVNFDEKDQRQYFQTQECRQAQGCSGCQCTQVIDTHSALVKNPNYSGDDDDDDKYRVELVKVDGCCKCLNS